MDMLYSAGQTLNHVIQAVRGCNGTSLGDQYTQRADLQGKWVIISGANNGIGLEAAKSFAEWGANLILACRDAPEWETHPTAAVDECKRLAEAEGHNTTIEWWELDMADLESVEAFCKRWLESDIALDILCNNAGTPTAAHSRMTKNGFQQVHQVNFLSHVLITLRLLPSLARSAEPRVVCSTSCLHHLGVFDLDHLTGDPDMRGGCYENAKLYYQIWLTELQSRCLKHPEYNHITINGLHPGFVASGIWYKFKRSNLTSLPIGLLLSSFAITSRQGGWAITYAATSPECRQIRGKYINRVWEAPAHPYCEDPDIRSKLWVKLDEKLHLREKGLLDVLGL